MRPFVINSRDVEVDAFSLAKIVEEFFVGGWEENLKLCFHSFGDTS